MKFVAFALAIAFTGAAHGTSEQSRLIAAGVTDIYVQIPRESGFVATTPESARSFQRHLAPADRRRVALFRYRSEALVAVFVRDVRGTRIRLGGVQREGEYLVVEAAVIPGVSREERLHYRVWRVPKAQLGERPWRVVVRTHPLFGPPRAFLEGPYGPLRLGTGSTCWSRGYRGYCADLIPPWYRPDVPEVRPHAGTPLVIRLAFTPVAGYATFFRGEQQERQESVELPRANPIRWTVPSDFRTGVGYLSITVTKGPDLAGSGQVSYELRIVAPTR